MRALGEIVAPGMVDKQFSAPLFSLETTLFKIHTHIPHMHTHTTVLCETNALRLVGGSNDFEGRVELCIDETWTSVCADGSWTNVDANVVCRQAGYSATGTIAYCSV